jgi:4-hydroxy-L-threonine phosphate dehydrogenase PdxA
VTPLLAISMGDLLGIGPEVIVKALHDGALRRRARWVVLGDSAAMIRAADACHLPVCWAELSAGALASNRFVPRNAGEVVVIDVRE